MRQAFDRSTYVLRVAALAAPLFWLATSAAAQPFEGAFGRDAEDTGARRVAPVSFCPDRDQGGFIAVGTSKQPPNRSIDVLLVRTDATGDTIWAQTYDVGPGYQDEGRAVAEARDRSGYIVAGWTIGALTLGRDVLLMKVDCAGKPEWTITYHGMGTGIDEAYDVVEARTGNDDEFGTNAGDILVAGRTSDYSSNVHDGFLLRTRADGTYIWDQRYATSASSEMLLALTEATPSIDDLGTGDVVAVGRLKDGAGLQFGFAVRADGNTGELGFPPQGAWRYGAGAEGFESVVERSGTPFDLVMVGSSGASAADVWAVRTPANPGAPILAQRKVYSSVNSGTEIALDVNQLAGALPVAPLGSLALTGRVAEPPASTLLPSDDAFLLLLDQATLAPIGDGRRFGGKGRQWGVSVADHAEGIVIAGVMESPYKDLYLVDTDGNGKTDCSRDWSVRSEDTAFPVERIQPMPVSFLNRTPQLDPAVGQAARRKICPIEP